MLFRSEALKEGLSEFTIEVIRKRSSVEGLPERDATLILLGREIFGDHKVHPTTYARAHKLFGTRMLIDIVALMGIYISTAGLLACFDMQLPEGEEPRLPDC